MTGAPKNNYNIRDVARMAGVSPATVSRVFRKNGTVKKETCEKVLAAAGQLNYLPSSSVSDDPKVLVMNVPSLRNPFYYDIIEGAKSSAIHNSYTIIITEEDFSSGSLPQYLLLLKHLNAKGLILLNYSSPEVEKSISQKIPLVQCCEFDNNSSVSCVGIDNIIGAEKATKHLVSLGRKKIAFLNGPANFKYAKDRAIGYLNVLKEYGIQPEPGWCINLPDVTVEYAYATTVELLSKHWIPDAIMTSSDICATGIIKAIHHKNFRIPEDIMVVGFDNTDISSMTMPTITTVSQPRFQMGYVACNLLTEQIKNPDTEKQTVLMETELIIRDSTILTF